MKLSNLLEAPVGAPKISQKAVIHGTQNVKNKNPGIFPRTNLFSVT